MVKVIIQCTNLSYIGYKFHRICLYIKVTHKKKKNTYTANEIVRMESLKLF